jgi:hypothetical protein
MKAGKVIEKKSILVAVREYKKKKKKKEERVKRAQLWKHIAS